MKYNLELDMKKGFIYPYQYCLIHQVNDHNFCTQGIKGEHLWVSNGNLNLYAWFNRDGSNLLDDLGW